METKTVKFEDESYSVSFNYLADTVRIYQKALGVLGMPRFLQFLINPESQTLYMRGTNSRDNNCLVVPSEDYRKRNCFVLHGRYFIKKVSTLAGWSLEQPYILPGKYMPEYNAIAFDLSDAYISSNLSDPDDNETSDGI